MAKFQFEATAPTALKDQYDVIIIGSGSSGLVSAIQAHELGLKPLILEKMPKIGGNTTRASSGMNAAETFVQLKHHVVDSYADFYHETFVGGGEKNDPAMLDYFTSHGALAIDWLAAHGIELDDLTITGGMRVKRTHRPSSLAPIGSFLVTELLKLVAADQLPLVTNATVTRLLQTAGKVTGLTVELADGHQRQISAPAVILATGGFGANPELIAKYRPDLKGYRTTNQPGATGDGINLSTQVGAALVDMTQIQVHPTVQQDTAHAFLIGEAVRGEGAILVNAMGQRFVNELTTRKAVTAAIDQLPTKHAYLILDQAVRDRVPAINFYDSVGLVVTGSSLAELAEKIDMPSSQLTTTVAKWNQAVTAQADTEFGRTTGMAHGLAKGPFYAIHIAPAVHYTMGGVKVKPTTQVVSTTDQVIPGLYAAGEIAGGLHGNNRIGGNSIAETVVFGRQAGQQVYRYLSTLK
ncbi:flavocytochrome c [Lactiplantibacillus sp. WILCCON 0030]|uniref:Flavocytochrome c n=1 Tax=Lactiplantibacillus brownii TaxID=3069269 RepID=A0ABU1A5X5_9LACO|nr:flavocytochrome c [Lactiplantibacillus brownii]MDQ7936105.1 flavocytochrome c [Lactiplantibacillus brownii]